MHRLLLIATGGTIASVQSHHGLTPGIGALELETYLGQLSHQCSTDSMNLFHIDSTNMQPEYWVKIAETVAAQYDRYDGFIITHGTDTLAYTAAALSYMLADIDKPVIVTGSQVPFTYQKSDAQRNLLDAARMACEPMGGVYVVFDGHVIAGTRAVKIRTKSFDAFESINYPDIATVDNSGDIHYHIPIPQSHRPLSLDTSLCPDVFLLKLHPGTKPELFSALMPLYKGIVIESFGNGGIPFLERNLLPPIEACVKAGIAVVVTTQCLQEGEDLSLYEVGRRVAENDRVILSKDMNTEAIVPKLMWALGQTSDLFEVKHIMETAMAHDASF
ncbi:asparaginase [Alicyclobacillaceae bacterium I2511]|jgi:L-asparaginase|nr:asparaginase [Alicyclobacillaceae bacterium I2511]